jgi:hypothetical protein
VLTPTSSLFIMCLQNLMCAQSSKRNKHWLQRYMKSMGLSACKDSNQERLRLNTIWPLQQSKLCNHPFLIVTFQFMVRDTCKSPKVKGRDQQVVTMNSVFLVSNLLQVCSESFLMAELKCLWLFHLVRSPWYTLNLSLWQI